MFFKKKGVSKVAFLLLTVGILFLTYGLWQMSDTKVSQAKALDTAEVKVDLPQKREMPKKEPEQIQPSPPDYHYQKGEVIGVLHIPKIKKDLPIIEGTGKEELKRGVGHYIDSAFPMQHDQIVLSGHRDTVFRHLGDLEKDDAIIVETQFGKSQYKVTGHKIVMADDRTVIRSTSPKEELILTTCYPFYYIGHAPKRYIVYAKPAFSQNVDQKALRNE